MKTPVLVFFLCISQFCGAQTSTIGGIINTYTPVLGFAPCGNKITVEDGSTFNTGDTVLLIQMKGAVIDSTNTAAFGNILDYKSSGNYEFNYVKSKVGNVIELKNVLLRLYDIPNGKVQLIRVPFYNNATVTSTLTCLPWDGSKGGVLVLNVANSIVLNNHIDVTGGGFKGGIDPVNAQAQYNCYEKEYYYPPDPSIASGKGEGIAAISAGKSFGRGALGNGGGGGNSHNSGGAGGGNISSGGFGGYEYDGNPCNGIVPYDNRGIGGKNLTYSNPLNKIFMGGGGGAGQSNSVEAFEGTGGNGGGIIIIMADNLRANGKKIIANGGNAAECGTPGSRCHEGMGGGGAAGNVLLKISSYLDNINVEVKGGKGGDMTASGFGKVGPGGGGSGGLLWVSSSSLSPAITVVNTGGVNGLCTAYSNDPWGTTAGQTGNSLMNLQIPIDNTPFRNNIDSVRIKSNSTSCFGFVFNGLGYTNTNSVATWQWNFGDATTSNIQNPSHTYSTPGIYTVKLIISDINGCQDSITNTITVNPCANGIGNIINTYTPVLGFAPCGNKITVEDASTFNAGDTVLMIQMKGALIDLTNTANFGTVTDYKNSGNYEFNFVKSKTGNIIELKNNLTRQYDIPTGKVQLVRVPYYTSATITSTLTCMPWDGSKGGILVLNARDQVDLAANIDVTGKGFLGGNSPNPFTTVLYCQSNNYFYAKGNLNAAAKGEGIAVVPDAYAWGKGAAANGGGSGNGHNSGGGGGGNGGTGGFGGYQLEACGNAPFDNRGLGGKSLIYNNTANKIFMGGGGGSGHTDNANGSAMPGGNGGGIIIIKTPVINTAGFQIKANGNAAINCNNSLNNCHDGSGGGGAGGTVLIENTSFTGNTAVDVSGGKGADLVFFNNAAGAGRIGPGGGGGAGVAWFNNSILPANVSVIKNGGANGVILQDNNNPWGATAGQPGINVFDLKIPYDIVLFKANIDSVRIKDSATSCSAFDFKGAGYTNTNPINSWQWYFGDGATAGTQNSSHNYSSPGTYTVKLVVTDISGCKDSALINVQTGNGSTPDFSYQQNVCNPLSVQFFSSNSNTVNPYWDFGDGVNVTGILNPVHVYTSYGTYQVKHIDLACGNSIVKTISVFITQDDIIVTPDTTICSGTSKQLRSIPSLGFCWSPNTYLNDPTSPNPIASPPQNITYYLNAMVAGNNLVVNGDFSNGNTGFTSDYNYATPNSTDGQYFIGTNPQVWNPSFSACKDHTTAAGNMMLVTGSQVPGVNVWKQTVTVTPNTNYTFSTWIQSLSAPNAAQLRMSVNGKEIGNLITANLPACTWTPFYTTWNSGNNTTAIISIVNKNTLAQQNAFALDDISFGPAFIKRDSVVITVDKAIVKANNDTTVCSGTLVQLNATGASSYAWTPATGLSNQNIANPVATITSPINYIVTGTTASGCTAKDTVSFTTFPKAVITTSNDTSICRTANIQLFASGGVSYLWSPAAGLSNPAVANPVASPAVTTTYLVTVNDNNSCSYKDSVKITIRGSGSFSVSPDQSVCINNQAQLSASGGTSYLWQPSTYLNNTTVANPVAIASATIIYSVKIKDSTCNDSTMLTTTVSVLPNPFVKATKTNDIDCSNNFSQLNATGAINYIWQPATSLNNSSISNPVANPAATTLYTVTGTDNNGCKNSDTVTVYLSNTNGGRYNMPNAFTPNNDGINECFGLKFWGNVIKLDFNIYNRFGERVFHTTDPLKCWDGKYKGILQDPGIFVYTIKATTGCDVIDKKGIITLVR